VNRPAEHLDIATLDKLRSLLQEGLDEVIEEFLRDSREQMEQMKQAAERGDREALVTLAHTLKGSSGNLGVYRLYRQCEDIEKDGRNDELDDSIARVEVLQQVYRDAVDALSRYMSR